VTILVGTITPARTGAFSLVGPSLSATDETTDGSQTREGDAGQNGGGTRIRSAIWVCQGDLGHQSENPCNEQAINNSVFHIYFSN
jgi:hypothetical protein